MTTIASAKTPTPLPYFQLYCPHHGCTPPPPPVPAISPFQDLSTARRPLLVLPIAYRFRYLHHCLHLCYTPSCHHQVLGAAGDHKAPTALGLLLKPTGNRLLVLERDNNRFQFYSPFRPKTAATGAAVDTGAEATEA
jgi:hypothetical protein